MASDASIRDIRKSGYAGRSMDGGPVDPGDVRRAATLFKVLSHPDRLRLACRMGDGVETTQKELLEEFDWPQSTMARHLAALRQAGLVEAERDGAEVLLRMATPVGLQLIDTVCDWLHGEAGPESLSAPGAPPARRRLA